MAKTNLYNMNGEVAEQIDLMDEVFGIEPNQDLLHRVVLMQLGNKRQGTSKAKIRSEVRGGGRKPYRQKGTGRARQGSIRSAQHVGGGVIFGPEPRSYRTSLNRKMRRIAMRSALSAVVSGEKIMVLNELKLNELKTKEMAKILNNLKAEKSTLVILLDKDRDVERCSANLPGVQIEMVNTMNVYDLLKYDHVIMTLDAVRKIEEVYVS